MQVTVLSGANSHPINVESGATIQSIYDEVGELFSLDENSSAKVNGVAAEFSRGVCDGDKVEFVKSTGTKG